MPPERPIVHVDLRADGTIARTGLDTGEHTLLVVHRPRVHTSEPAWTAYLPRSILLLPRVGPHHPWAPVVAWLRHLQQHLDHGGLVVGHREADEPPEFAELRARALLHFLRDAQSAWVALASAHGRVQDTQAYLDYLHRECGWDTAVPSISDVADPATARAVEAFQRTYNRAFRADIYEDGVIGEQTLGAVFEVAKAELVYWLELGGTSLDALRPYAGDLAWAVDPAYDGRRWTQLLAFPAADRYDLAREPAGAGLYPIARLLPLPVADVPAPVRHVLEIRVLDEWGEPLPHLAYELSVAGETRFGETDEHGLLAEPMMPPGDVVLRLADGAPVLFHDLYQPRGVFPLAAGGEPPHDLEAEYHARDDDDDDDHDEDASDELDEDDDVWGALAEDGARAD